MRPLVTFDPLTPSQPVYDPAQDDFQALLQPEVGNMDAWQATLDPLADGLLGAQDDLFNTLDSIGSIFDSLDATFGKINDSIEDIDYSQIIVAVSVQDKLLDDGLTGWAPDIGALASSFADEIVRLIQEAWAILMQGIVQLIQSLASLVTWIWNQVLILTQESTEGL